MARLESNRLGVGAVDHPETGELIQLGEEHALDVAQTVADAYPSVSIVAGEDTPPDDPKCGVNGCGRDVESPEATCWQHDKDDE